MMPPLNIVGPSYKDDNPAMSNQACINYFVETEEKAGARSATALKGTPGLILKATVGDGPWRGADVMDAVLYVVSGTSLYSVASDWASTELGTIPGTGRVGMANNGYQLIVVNGTNGYVYDVDAGTFVQITDDEYLGSAYTATFLNQYIIQDGPSGQFQHSDLSDATAYEGTDIYSAEFNPDPVMAVIADHLELWVFGTETTEVWINQVTDDGAFQRASGTPLERGLGARYSVVKLDNSLIWLADNGMVYRANGYVPERVSDNAVDQDIADHDLSQFFAFGYYEEGNAFYCLVNPNGKTWIYNCKNQMWHQRKSYNLERWRVNGYAKVYGLHIVGDYENGNLYEMTREAFDENGEPLIAERISGYLHADGQAISIPMMKTVMDTGTADSYDDDFKVELRTSGDSGRSWSTWRLRSLGLRGEYRKEIKWHGLGRFKDAALFHLRVSAPVRRDIIAANGQVDVLEST